MKRFTNYTKPLWWVLSLLTIALVAGCGSNGGANNNASKAITAYSLAGATGVINETTKTIYVAVPYGTNVTAQVASFTTSGAAVTISAVAQTSGTTPNNFTGPVTYVVTAIDKSTANYTVIVAVATNAAKSITAFSVSGVVGTINQTARTIAVTVPYGTNVTALAAAFTTTGASVKIGTVSQSSGVTTADFSNAVVYTVSAVDTTTATYTVTVTVATNYAKSITAYSLAGVTGVIDETSKEIAVTVPFGTSVTALVATYTSTGTGAVRVLGVAQTSTVTQNDFTSPVSYTVSAANNTTAIYVVTVTVAKNPAKAITAFSLDSVNGAIDEGAHTIKVTMPIGTVVTASVATFSTTGESVKVGTTPQVSGSTTNDFTAPVTYQVTAADATTQTYAASVTFAAGPVICTGSAIDCIDLKTAANYVILSETGITNVPTSIVTGNIGVFPTTAAIALTCPEVTGVIYSPDATGPSCKVTDATGLNIAVGDKLAAYNDGFGRTETSGANLDIGSPAGTVGTSPFLAPGVYVWTSNVSIPADITIAGTNSAADVWIFKVAGTLDIGANVLLSGGATSNNIFWVTSGIVTVAPGKHMEGVVLSASDIVMQTGSTANGRLLSKTQVVLQAATVAKP